MGIIDELDGPAAKILNYADILCMVFTKCGGAFSVWLLQFGLICPEDSEVFWFVQMQLCEPQLFFDSLKLFQTNCTGRASSILTVVDI